MSSINTRTPTGDRKKKPLSQSEISTLQALNGNNACADCNAPHPQWASITYGTLHCLSCSGAHRGLGVHISFIRSVTLDDWDIQELNVMMSGSNASLNSFLEKNGVVVLSSTCSSKGGDRELIRAKYTSEAASTYRDYIRTYTSGAEIRSSAASTADNDQLPKSLCKWTLDMLDAELPSEPSPSDYYSLIFDWLLGKMGITRTQLALLALSGEALAYNLLSRIVSKYVSRNSTRLICASAMSLPFVAVGGLIYTLSQSLIRHRLPAYKSARNVLLEQINAGRAQRRKTYDLYLPASKEIAMGLIFIPGALVDHTAYSILAQRLTNAGILVAVLNVEPHRTPTATQPGSTKEDVLRVMYDILAGRTADSTDVGVASVKEWAIGGHSMGSFCAFNLICDMKPGITKLLCLGAGKESDLGSSSLQDDASVEALIVVGSEDGFYRGSTEKERARFIGRFPIDRTTFVEVEGGNHSGFAHYGPQIFPVRDGERSITLDEQQNICVTRIVNFLLGK